MGMIKSMTGFGRSEIATKFGLFTAELRTLNHKFLEITFKLPNSLSVFDEKVKKLIKNRVRRGKIYLNLIHETTRTSEAGITIDGNLAENYVRKLKKLKRKLKVQGDIKLSDIISFPGVIGYKLGQKDVTAMWPSLKKVIEKALDKLLKERGKEGRFLFKDLIRRIGKIKKTVSHIKRSARSNINTYRKRLRDRIKELSAGCPVDKGRIEMEVAIFAKNSDITEELTRLDNHIDNFTGTIRKDGALGKKLDFIAQELHREINTIGSKSSGFNVSKGVIEAKTEIEKIREQLKNIE